MNSKLTIIIILIYLGQSAIDKDLMKNGVPV